MLRQKQKNIIPYKLYASKKQKEPDYLCKVIKKYKHIEKVEAAQGDEKYEQEVKRKLNQRRIQQIKKIHKSKKVSEPEPFIKRTWVSPLEASQKKQQGVYFNWKKISGNFSELLPAEQEKAKKVMHVLNINKKMHLFGQYLYCDFEQKQNGQPNKTRTKDKKMDLMHKQYSKLMNSMKKVILVCNKNSELTKRIFVNPLKQDKFYQQIIRQNDDELSRILIQSLSVSGKFTFTSYIQFYELFVWQQTHKNFQVEFVIKALMGSAAEISCSKLSNVIDFFCSRINLVEHGDSMSGFNEVMKKLIFGNYYERSLGPEQVMTRQALAQSLQANEECISIFINVFYSQ